MYKDWKRYFYLNRVVCLCLICYAALMSRQFVEMTRIRIEVGEIPIYSVDLTEICQYIRAYLLHSPSFSALIPSSIHLLKLIVLGWCKSM